MQGFPILKCLCVTICVMIIAAEMTSAAPAYSDYENIRDLYELLLQREALEDQLGQHQVVRKSNRSPSLRLRFGRRSFPPLPLASKYSMSQSVDAEHADD